MDSGELESSVPSRDISFRKMMWSEKTRAEDGGKNGDFLSRPLGKFSNIFSRHLVGLITGSLFNYLLPSHSVSFAQNHSLKIDQNGCKNWNDTAQNLIILDLVWRCDFDRRFLISRRISVRLAHAITMNVVSAANAQKRSKKSGVPVE